MGERDEQPDGTEFPDIGTDMAPSPEQIVEGKVGNGSWERFTPELAQKIQVERKEYRQEISRTRREAYEDGVREALGTIADLEHGIIRIGIELMQRLEAGEPLTKRELDTLKLAQDQAKEMKDRGLGKSKPTAEVNHNTSILSILTGKVQVEHD